MSRALLSILVSGHGHRFECGHFYNCNGLDYYVSNAEEFDPVAGFPLAGLSLAVPRFYFVVLDAHSVSSLL